MKILRGQINVRVVHMKRWHGKRGWCGVRTHMRTAAKPGRHMRLTGSLLDVTCLRCRALLRSVFPEAEAVAASARI